MGAKQAKIALKSLPVRALVAINQKLGYRFVTKFGSQGLINLIDFVPIVGGAVSGTVNALLTYQAGCAAYRVLKDGPQTNIVIVGDKPDDIDLEPDPA